MGSLRTGGVSLRQLYVNPPKRLRVGQGDNGEGGEGILGEPAKTQFAYAIQRDVRSRGGLVYSIAIQFTGQGLRVSILNGLEKSLLGDMA